MSRPWPLLFLLMSACAFDGAGLSATDGALDAKGSPDVTVPDVRSTERASGADTLPDFPGISDGPDPCTPNPCQNGGTCAPGDGGAVCQCAPGFEGPSCSECALGHAGASCAACPATKLSIPDCTHATIACALWIDGDIETASSNHCPGGCATTDVDFDLGTRRFVQRLRFLSDWWAKRPGTWELWASDDNANFSLVMQARSNHAPWRCVQGEPCTAVVPAKCCPGGATQDTSVVGPNYPKWDDFSFSGVTARYWRFRITKTDDADALIMRELELFGHDCLGELACATSSCGPGVCTGQENAQCSCAHCEATASCTSAFTGVAPPCTTPQVP